MTACGSDFLFADNFDAAEMLLELNSVIRNLPSAKKSGHHHCYSCSKICLSESGLSRHVKQKYLKYLTPNEKSKKIKYKLDIFLLKAFIEKKVQN